IPGKDGNPITVTIGEDGKGKVPNSELPDGKVPGTGKITEPGKPAVEVPNVTIPSKIIPGAPTTEQPGKIEITQKPNGDAIVTPKKPDGSTYPPGTKVEIPGEDGTTITVTIGDNGSGEVPNDNLPKGDLPGTGTVTEPNKNPSQPVDVTTPARKSPTLDVEQDPKTGDVTVTPKKPDGSTYPPGTKVEIPGKDGNPITVTIGEDGKGKVPNSELPDGKVPGTGKITEPGKPAVEVPNVETPSKIIPGAPTTEQPVEIEITQKPNGDAIVTPKKPDGSTYPPGTKVEIPGEDKDGNPITITVTIGDNGSGEVPNDKLPKKAVPGTGTVTEPNKNPSKPIDVTTPARKTPTLEVEQDPKTGDVTVTPKKPDGSTYPPGTKVEIPGKDGNPITVTIGEDGKGKVPNSELPDGKVPGTGKITEPGKSTEEVPNVETPARKTPTLEVEQDPKTGDVTVTPKKPDGSTYPPGTKVEIPGKDGNPITVTIGEDGKGKVPNSELPDGKVPGTGKITEPGKSTEEVPNVETPARKTPTLDVEQDPKTGDVTVTPKKPDGSTYPPGTKVEIPGKDGNPITVTIGEDGKGKVPNSELPDGKVPGTGKITEPGKSTEEVPNVETPSKIIPGAPTTEQPVEIEITQKPNGDAIVTPKKPDGSTYPPGTKVEIPGEDKDGNPITITVTIGDNGSGEVPNDKLPKKAVPGTGTVTEPNKNPSKPVDVTTPARKTPTLEVEQDPKTGDVTVTPKKPDGSTYPPGTKVEIPGKDGNPITVTIGEDGKGKVPNSELPDGKVPGTGKITEPGKSTEEVPDVTTPGKVTPATPTPNAVTPNADQVDTKTTVDNGAKSNDSQNVLPNTGTESNATLASLGLLGLLSGFGLVARKKKED
ncbi:LPXTG cell wall anchor domain-containing protein, partial [Streptococcus mitis]|uniref:LPXTG cell wall anchor domain-containing protein n=1 Tax=Streptococcus mitis TaxID=28037 RepID=UPI0039EF23E2